MKKKSSPTKAEKPESEKKVKPEKKAGDKGKRHNRSRQLLTLAGILLLLIAVFLLLSFVSYSLGAWKNDDFFSDPNIGLRDILFNNNLIVENFMGRLGAAAAFLFIKQWFGLGSFLFILILFTGGIRLSLRRHILPFGKTLVLSVLAILLLSIGLAFLLQGNEWSLFGGFFGHLVNSWLEGVLGKIGAGLVIAFVILAYLVLVFNLSMKFSRKPTDDALTKEAIPVITAPIPLSEPIEETPSVYEFDLDNTKKDKEPGDTESGQESPVLEVPPAKETQDEVIFTIDEGLADKDNEVIGEEQDEVKRPGSLDTPYDPTLDLAHYQFPSLELLSNYGSGTSNVKKEELEENKNKIVQTLNNYSIQIEKIIATIGPTVTLYEIVPAPGIRISKIKNLEDDIALSLSAYGIRIIAPIPGKGTIGIEVPNQSPEIVSMRSVLSSEKFQNSKFELPVALGKTISNETFVADLTKMPHLLMAGATGQGKSVGLNAIITSLLYKKHPSEVKFVMVDPKKVELSLFSKIENHYLAKLPDFDEAIITDTRKVVRVLNSMLIEMDNRYNLLKDAQVRNIKEYNIKFISRKLNPEKGHRFLPYIILVVDEFADLIMTAGKEIETPLTRLAQLARAIGIHLIIATQRPSVNIITGTIKANFPARVAFRVISKIDSRTILDTGGADQLIGRGDMLLSMGSDILRLQCAFIDTGEIDTITEFIGVQQGFPHAFHLPEYFEEGDDNKGDFDSSDRDEMFEEAARMIVQYQQGSTSLLQRKLKLGYNRAGRIMDQLEAAGIVGPSEGSRPREVRIKDIHHLEQFLREGYL
ncbi:MAG: DNA translocase FtsK [Bacteroidales bacterium]